MKKQKKIFLVFALIFLGIMIYISYDIAVKTTFPGSQPQLKERLLQDQGIHESDTSYSDTVESL